jgi:transposase-like protein
MSEPAVKCPNCGKPMRISRVLPNPSGEQEDVNVYKCSQCNVHFITEDHYPLTGQLRS